MKKFVFSVAPRATGRLQIKLSGTGDENDSGSKLSNGPDKKERTKTQ